MKTVGKREKGQNLVEFALILPVFLLLVVGMAEFGRAWMTRNILTGAAREGARVAIVQTNFDDDPSGSKTQGEIAATAVLGSALIPVPPATVTVFDPGGSFPAIQVDVSYQYSVLLAGFIPGLPDPLILTGTATMRRERY